MICVICMLIVLVFILAALALVMYRNEERAIVRLTYIEEQLKTARAKEEGYENKIFKLECKNEALAEELEREKNVSALFEEMLDIQKARIVELEAVIDNRCGSGEALCEADGEAEQAPGGDSSL